MTAYFKFACPGCAKSLKVSEDLAGETRKCPYCQNGIVIPEPNSIATSGDSLNFGLGNDTVKSRRSSERRTKKGRRKRPKKSWFSFTATHSDVGSTDVNIVQSGLMGLCLTAIWLSAMKVFRTTALGELFWDRGYVPFFTTFLMFWSVSILVLKWYQIKHQREAMLLDVLPMELSEQITLDSLDLFIDHINELPEDAQKSFLINRVVRGIEHFRVRHSAAETVTMMESQSVIDANNVAGSYTLVKVFVWALPILGFIGTVVGVSAAVASLAGSLESAEGINGMKDALNDVFAGLGTAFDTTLLALIMSMIVKIPTSALQKSEEDLITAVDEYCNENLLRRLNDGKRNRNDASANGSPMAFRDAFEAVLGNHQAELQRQLTLMNTAATQIQESLSSVTAELSTVARETAGLKTDISGSFSGLTQGLEGLNTVLGQLGEQTVVVQQVEPPKRGWFGFGSRGQSGE